MVARSRYMKNLSDISKQFESEIADATLRRQPYGILLSGPPGSGKTSLAIQLAQHLLKAMGEIPSADKIVTLNETDEYQSEYRSDHKVVIFDDLDQEKTSVGNPKNPYRKIIDFINNIRKTALNPNLEMKGSVQIQPEIVIVTTNAALQINFDQVVVTGCSTWVQHPGAIMRRFKSMICADFHGSTKQRGYGLILGSNITDCMPTPYSKYMTLFHIMDLDVIIGKVTEDFLKHYKEQTEFVNRTNRSFGRTLTHSPLKMLLTHMSTSIPSTISDLFRDLRGERQELVAHSNDGIELCDKIHNLSISTDGDSVPEVLDRDATDEFNDSFKELIGETVQQASHDDVKEIVSNHKKSSSYLDYIDEETLSDYFNQIDPETQNLSDLDPNLSPEAQFYLRQTARHGGLGYDKDMFHYVLQRCENRQGCYFGIFDGGYIVGYYPSTEFVEIHLIYGSGPAFGTKDTRYKLLSYKELDIIHNIKQRRSLAKKIHRKRKALQKSKGDTMKGELVAHSGEEKASSRTLTLVTLVNILTSIIKVGFLLIYRLYLYCERPESDELLQALQLITGKLQGQDGDSMLMETSDISESSLSETSNTKDFDSSLPVTVVSPKSELAEEESLNSTQKSYQPESTVLDLVTELGYTSKDTDGYRRTLSCARYLHTRKDFPSYIFPNNGFNRRTLLDIFPNTIRGSCPSLKEASAQFCACAAFLQSNPEHTLIGREVMIPDVGSCDLVFYSESHKVLTFVEAKASGRKQVREQVIERKMSYDKLRLELEANFAYYTVTKDRVVYV